MFLGSQRESPKTNWPAMCPTALSQVPRNQWVLQWPGQVVICVSSIFWTQEVSQALVEKTLPVSEPIMKLVGQIQTWIEFEWHIIRVDVFSKIIAKIVNLWCHRSQGSFGDSRTENLELGLSWSSVAQEVSRFFLDRNSRLQNSFISLCFQVSTHRISTTETPCHLPWPRGHLALFISLLLPLTPWGSSCPVQH